MVGQGFTVLVVGADRDCSDIFFLSPIISFFLPLSGMDGWVTCGIKDLFNRFFVISGR